MYLCSALPVVIEFLLLLVYLFSVINFYYFHSNNIVEYLVHNPIVAHSDSVSALTSQLLITVRSRIVGERIHRTLQCRIVWLRESFFATLFLTNTLYFLSDTIFCSIPFDPLEKNINRFGRRGRGSFIFDSPYVVQVFREFLYSLQ